MKIKIPLLKVEDISAAKSRGHAYPFQIALQSAEFIHANMFHTIFSNIATSEYAKVEGAMEKMENKFLSGAYTKESYNMSWKCIKKYLDAFSVSTRQSVLITMSSHWDWYIRKLSDFIFFGREHIDSPVLSPKQDREFKRIGNCAITHQLNILESVSGVKFDLDSKDINNLAEISRVRNLALHNRWEVDERYIELSGKQEFEIGEVRVVPLDELFSWKDSFDNVLHTTCRIIAEKYESAPEYPI